MIIMMRKLLYVSSITVVLGFVSVGCQSNTQSAENQAAPNEDSQETSLMLGGKQDNSYESASIASGAKLWEQNCIRCHNPRVPASLSDAQWKIVMRHMRVRANLTAEEHESILRFLQAAN